MYWCGDSETITQYEANCSDHDWVLPRLIPIYLADSHAGHHMIETYKRSELVSSAAEKNYIAVRPTGSTINGAANETCTQKWAQHSHLLEDQQVYMNCLLYKKHNLVLWNLKDECWNREAI